MMTTSVLEQYRVSDLIQWYDQKQLVLNPQFQRRSVWSSAAKVFLVDTILRQLPLPKVFMRTKVDLLTKKSFREVVDGQQRLRAIIEFSQDRFTLTSRAKEFNGLKYSAMPQDLKERFLSYAVAVDQLINASDGDVLEVFARLNVYNVKLNAAELRHAQFQGNFKWAVHEASRRNANLWERYNLLSVGQRLRMQDDSLMAEMFGIVILGVTNGGQARIDRIYRELDSTVTEEEIAASGAHVDETLRFIMDSFDEALLGSSTIARAPHFLMLFAAVAHALFGIPDGEMENKMPHRNPAALSNRAIVEENLAFLDRVLSSDEPEPGFREFWTASVSSTQRIASRRIRFPMFYRALLPEALH